jgi:hypothetical protein
VRAQASALGLCLACAAEPTPERDPVERQPATEAPVRPDPAPTEPTPVPPPPSDPAPAAAELLDTVDALGELHRRHAADCPALADAITTFHAQHATSLAEASPEVLAHIDANEVLRVRMRTAMESVMSASMACRDDPAFVAAGDALFGSKPK